MAIITTTGTTITDIAMARSERKRPMTRPVLPGSHLTLHDKPYCTTITVDTLLLIENVSTLVIFVLAFERGDTGAFESWHGNLRVAAGDICCAISPF